MNIIKEHFNSVHELLNILDARKNNKVMAHSDASETGSEDFTGTASYKEARELFEKGWEEPLEKIKTGLKTITSSVEVKRRRVTTGVVGYAPHVPNAIQGLPNSMILTEMPVQKERAIAISYNISECAWVEADTFIKSGIAVLSVINTLELQGIRVKLSIAFFTSAQDDEYVYATVDLKDYREHLDLKKLCFPIVHPSMFRRFGFKWLETCEGLTNEGYAHGYGRAFEYHKDGKAAKIYDEHLLADNEYPLDLTITRNNGYDVDKIIEAAKILKNK